ncbi:MAG: hypothetical protein QXI33_01605 [Candidatus Pacearchaeota archaeon]
MAKEGEKKESVKKKSLKKSKLKPVKLKPNKKNLSEDSELEDVLDKKEVFDFDNSIEFLRKTFSGKAPVLSIENSVSTSAGFTRISRKDNDEKPDFSYDVNGKRGYIEGGDINNVSDVNTTTLGESYKPAESSVAGTLALRRDIEELNSFNINRPVKDREVFIPLQEINLKDEYSSQDKLYRFPAMDADENHRRKIPGDRRRRDF